ncbi:MAG: GH13_26 / GH13 / GH13_20 [uncultured Chthoniobacterales bacterium]|uniref:GH13_26 / GH13 / GH13_20 n=1 Tax=uncultured Chthoniobacterales bacterium TaxID=1836801 RepID=A0A6J4HEB5_9BACT|nr:MAG: GH13_26 / GH13 / GH13_20 [uncultured Chthoniobacterales bacterium]
MSNEPRIPTSTYRLQFNRTFTFNDAREIVPYLHALGIDDCYASPYFQARAESLHGYDITDHNKLNAAIGSREEYDAFVAELHARGMGQVLDFVPNHMGIGEPLNQWWMDVLENGPSSVYAPYFDIDWRPLKSDLHDKVLLPILGDQYGRVLERGELKVRFEGGAFYLNYYEHEWPIAPGTYRHVLQIALGLLEPHRDEDFYAEFQSIMTALDYLPRRTETDPARIAERAREKEIIKRRLDRRCQEAPQVLDAIQRAVTQINGTPGDARSFDALDELVNDQAYRLSFWRVAAEEINYRRFFDINDLAAIKMELPEVFDSAHKLLLELVGNGAVTGLRIDHPDGLYLPAQYFAKLQQRCAQALAHGHSERSAAQSRNPDGSPSGPPRDPSTSPSASLGMTGDARAVYLVVEKILSGKERLPGDWPVHGTTGYDFGRLVNNVLCDSSAEDAITKAFRRFVGHSMHFGHLVYAKKRLVMRLSLANDVNVLGAMLDRLSEQNRWFRDFTLEALSRAVRETIACFPVYRTYVTPGQPVSPEDRDVIDRAIAAAKRRNPAIETSVFNFLRDILLFRFPENLDDEARAAHVHFVLKFQQCTGPIMAKGLEDTVFYIFNRLAALNEVGGEPQHFGISVAGFHEENTHYQQKWPMGMLTTSTHDTKRSEDVRARMVAISELPHVWRTSLQRWRTINRRLKRQLEEAQAPDANEEYLLYQTLLGTWPMQPSGAPVETVTEEYVGRIQAYMTKALKEAKINTSWIQPNEEWDSAMRDFITGVLEPSAKNKFVPTFLPLAAQMAQLGAVNSLSQVLLKMTAPGVPDVYQGNEIWDFSLVDPDNRRPVDYQLRKQMLEALESASPDELLRNWADGRIKLLVTSRMLRFRRDHPELFLKSSYVPLATAGTHAESCIAFAREEGSQWIVTVAPRLSSRVGFPPIGDLWQDTSIELPEAAAGGGTRELFTGRELRMEGRALMLSEAMSVLPFAVYTNA